MMDEDGFSENPGDYHDYQEESDPMYLDNRATQVSFVRSKKTSTALVAIRDAPVSVAKGKKPRPANPLDLPQYAAIIKFMRNKDRATQAFYSNFNMIEESGTRLYLWVPHPKVIHPGQDWAAFRALARLVHQSDDKNDVVFVCVLPRTPKSEMATGIPVDPVDFPDTTHPLKLIRIRDQAKATVTSLGEAFYRGRAVGLVYTRNECIKLTK